ncbi:MAG TPA: hypothetical protein VMZ26_15985, partial [Pyrinomonadaceae bacterium]|nr:hypothetical protein [Pyrinomonadaceae bacterium]
MKRKIYIAFIGMSLTLLVHSSAYAQQPRPTPIGRPVSGKPAVPLAQSSNSSKQEGRTQTSTPPKVKLAPASLSIKEIKEPVNESNIKVLVQNTGDLPSKGGAAKVTIDLLKEVNGSNSPMYFWVDVGKVLGKGLPMSVMTAFTKTVPIPTIAPGKSVWISVGFVLPDPGTYADRPYSPMPFA